MSLRFIQPGASAALRHPKTGAILQPLYTRKDGSLVWPVLGASEDDPNDPKYTGGDGDDDSDDDADDDSDEDEDEEDDDKKKSSKKSKSKKDDDDEDDEDEDDSRIARASRQAKKYRLALRESEARERALDARLKALENKGKPDADKDKPDVESAELKAAQDRADKAEKAALLVRVERLAERGTIQWVDLEDVMAALQRDEDLWDDIVDEDGTVDKRELTRALRDLAKRKPHLVKPKVRDQDDEEDDDKGSGSTRQMNGKRKGSGKSGQSREELAKKFPVLGRL